MRFAARFVCGVGDAAPLLWGKVYHTFLLYGRAAFSGGRVPPPYHTKNCTAFGLCSFIKIIVLSAGAYSVPELSCVSPPVSPVSASGSLWASVWSSAVLSGSAVPSAVSPVGLPVSATVESRLFCTNYCGSPESVVGAAVEADTSGCISLSCNALRYHLRPSPRVNT